MEEKKSAAHEEEAKPYMGNEDSPTELASTGNDAGDATEGGSNDQGEAGLCNVTNSPAAYTTVDPQTYCTLTNCSGTAAGLLDGYVCDRDATPYSQVRRRVGCGVETITRSYGYYVEVTSFDQTTGSWLGGSMASDTPWGPCDAFRYVSSPPLDDCENAVEYECVKSCSDGGANPADE